MANNSNGYPIMQAPYTQTGTGAVTENVTCTVCGLFAARGDVITTLPVYWPRATPVGSAVIERFGVVEPPVEDNRIHGCSAVADHVRSPSPPVTNFSNLILFESHKIRKHQVVGELNGLGSIAIESGQYSECISPSRTNVIKREKSE